MPNSLGELETQYQYADWYEDRRLHWGGGYGRGCTGASPRTDTRGGRMYEPFIDKQYFVWPEKKVKK